MNDKKVIVFFSGILFLILLVKLLKYIIKQERPNKSKGYGMPSSRAAIMSYILFFIIYNFNLKTLTKIIIISIAFVIIFLKYYLREHSPFQLLIGSILGKIIAYLSSMI